MYTTSELTSSSNAMIEELYLSRMHAWMSPNVYENDNSGKLGNATDACMYYRERCRNFGQRIRWRPQLELIPHNRTLREEDDDTCQARILANMRCMVSPLKGQKRTYMRIHSKTREKKKDIMDSAQRKALRDYDYYCPRVRGLECV